MQMKSFRNWKISAKVLSISSLVIIGMFLWQVFFILPQFKAKLIEGKMDEMRHNTEIVYSLVAEYQDRIDKKEFSFDEGQKRAITRISKFRFSKEGYFWINDMSPKMIMHPINSELVGKDLSDYKDKNGKLLFVEFVNICKEKGEGFVSYLWNKPGEDESKKYDKLSYVRLFKPWGWVIGQGVYTADITGAIIRLRNMAIAESIAFFLIILALTSFIVKKTITKPLSDVMNLMDKINNGVITDEIIAVKASDEIGKLSVAFNSVNGFFNEITEATKRIAGGDYSKQIPPKSDKDVLSHSLNTMMQEIDKNTTEIHGLNMDMAMQLTEYFTVLKEIGEGNMHIKANTSTGNDLFDQLGKSTNELIGSLNGITAVVKKVAGGDYGETVTLRSDNDEMSKSLNEMIKAIEKSSNELHMNNMDLAMQLTEYFDVLNKIGAGDLLVKANEKTGNDLFDQLGKTTNGMIESLKSITEAVKRLAGGNLTESVAVRSDKDELSIAFNQMALNIKNLVLKVKDQANALANSSSTLAQISEQSSQTISQLSMTSSQISASTSSVAQSSQSASSAAQNADASSRKGKELMGRLVEKIRIIRDVEDKSATAMNGLSVSSAKIGEIVSVITKIADQTNLLSLNAAIEAARAGEAGHGFAVVADEVRKLAESSASSAQEIARIIKSVQEETKSATDSVKNGKKEIEEGSQLTVDSNDRFIEIAAQVENIAHQVEEIAAAAEESAASSEEAAASSEEQAAAMQEIASTATNLSNSAKVLLEAVERFKV